MARISPQPGGEPADGRPGRAWPFRSAPAVVTRLLRALPRFRRRRPAAQAATMAPSSSVPPIVAHCDGPGPEMTIVRHGHLLVHGWALALAGIDDITVLVDGQRRARLSLGGDRPDVAAALPQFGGSVKCGFSGRVTLDRLEPGEHSLVIQFLARDGARLEQVRPFRIPDRTHPDPDGADSEYLHWLARRSPSTFDLERMRAEGERLAHRPTLGLLIDVDHSPDHDLTDTVDSLLAQTYGRWELFLAADDAMASPARTMLDRLAERDPRITLVHAPGNLDGAQRRDAALDLATGEFVGLLDVGDRLPPNALFEVARALNASPNTDLIYTDEDWLDATGKVRWNPFFKPDWSPDLLLSTNYVGRLALYRRSLVQALGGFRPRVDGDHDYDLALRFTERTGRIVHLPAVLCSRRGGSRVLGDGEPAQEAGRHAIADALARRGIAGHVEPGPAPGRWRVRYPLQGRPAVTLVIPSGGKMEHLRPCLESVLEKTTYDPLRLLVIDNSDGTAVGELCREIARRDPRLTCVRHRVIPFNYSTQNNYAMTLVDTPYVILLNDDVTVITPDWVESMLEHAQRPEVGVVGARLLYPDRSIQHAGVILGPYETCSHAFRLFPEDDPGHHDLPRLIRNCSAVTFACAMMRRSVYDEVGGLDEVNFAVAYNDVDMCLRIWERGYRVVYTPHALLIHHESATKSVSVNPGEIEYLRERWGASVRRDPFYNPNLTRKIEDYSLNLDAPATLETPAHSSPTRADEAHDRPPGPRSTVSPSARKPAGSAIPGH